MRQSWMMGLAVALAIVVLPAPTFAQVPKETTRASKAMKGKNWEKRMERVRAVFLKRLSEEMKLDEATHEKMAKSFERFRDQYRSLRGERVALAAKLQAAVERGAPEAELEAILSEFDGFRTRRHQLMGDRTAEVRQILGTRRYAQYVLFRQQFRKELRKKLHERRHKKGQ